MRLIQYRDEHDKVCVARSDTQSLRQVQIDGGTLALARSAARSGRSLESEADARGYAPAPGYEELAQAGRVLPPLTHPDPAHCWVSGTGLTHLGSADTRDAMHQGTVTKETDLSDSMKMFRMGVEGGKPAPGAVGVQPEWFYKGDGTILTATEQPLEVPAFARDAGEEPELAGVYLIGDRGHVWRLGFTLSNELSDHVVERENYLWLAHSKLRPCAVGPELLTGPLPAHLQGTSRIIREGRTLWEKPFLTGERNMSHSVANLEWHHFKYNLFRRPGDIHFHFLGTATLSFADGVHARDGDVFEIQIPEFGAVLRNTLRMREQAAFDSVSCL